MVLRRLERATRPAATAAEGKYAQAQQRERRGLGDEGEGNRRGFDKVQSQIRAGEGCDFQRNIIRVGKVSRADKVGEQEALRAHPQADEQEA